MHSSSVSNHMQRLTCLWVFPKLILGLLWPFLHEKNISQREREEKKERERKKKEKSVIVLLGQHPEFFPGGPLPLPWQNAWKLPFFSTKKCFEGRTKEVWAFGRSLKITVFRSSAGVNQDNCSIATVVKNWLTLPSIMARCYGGIFLYSLDRGRNCFYCVVHVFLLTKHFLSLIA